MTKKLKVIANSFSESAKKAIIDAGGTVELIIKPKKAQPKKNVKKSEGRDNKKETTS